METLLDPKTRKEFLYKRNKNNKLHLDRDESIRIYKELEEKSGLSSNILRAASRGDEHAFMLVASSPDLSNKEKNNILSNTIGRYQDDTTVKQLPSYTLTESWKSPVRATICSPIEGYTNHKKCVTFGGGQYIKENFKPAKSTSVDFSDIDPALSYQDIFVSKIKNPNLGLLNVSPISAEKIIAKIHPAQNKFIAFNADKQKPIVLNSGGIINYLDFFK